MFTEISNNIQGIRVALADLDSHANRYERYIEPLLCISIDYYIRVIVRVQSGSARAKDNVWLVVAQFIHTLLFIIIIILIFSKRHLLYVCSGCESHVLQPIITNHVNGNSVRFVHAHAPTVPERCTQCNSRFRVLYYMFIIPFIHMYYYIYIQII